MKEFDSTLTLKNAHRINIKSIVASQLFFNFFGQVFARAALTEKTKLGRSISALVTSIERACGLGTLIILTVGLGLWATGLNIGLFQKNLIIIIYIPIISLLLILTYHFQLHPRARRLIRATLSRSVIRNLFYSLLITLIMHITTLLCYLLLISEIYDTIVNNKILLASLFSMSVASIPVVPGGWGVREAGAGIAFSYAGFDLTKGIAVGLGIGISSAAALTMHMIWIGWTYIAKKKINLKDSAETSKFNTALKENIINLSTMTWLAPIITGIFLAFQIQLNSNDIAISLNLADPFAVVIALSALLFTLKNIFKAKAWVFHGVFPALLIMGASITISFFIGFWRFGLIEWAFFNRLIGYGIILSFFLTGAFLVHMNGHWVIKKTLDSILYISAIIVLIEFASHLLSLDNLITLLEWHATQYTGFLTNRNSWGFFLLVTFFSWIGFNEKVKFNWLLVLVSLGIYATSSRAAILTFLICFIFLSFLNFRKSQAVVKVFLMMLVLYYSVPVASEIAKSNFHSNIFASKHNAIINSKKITSHASDHERMATIEQGWGLFSNAPLWGAGLGRNMQLPVGDRQVIAVIHNSFLWVLAEFGIIGFILFFAPFICLLIQFFRQKMSLQTPRIQALFFCVIIFCAFSMVHEVAYQRIFWFFMGLFTASAGVFRKLHISSKQE